MLFSKVACSTLSVHSRERNTETDRQNLLLAELQLLLCKESQLPRCMYYIVTAKLTSVNWSITESRSFIYLK